ncbi:MAG TPA: hypothetical protein VN704_00495 [Verrucomicrobiae bacterium]|nr:hypothetical protein [Verrucomicrobiae bacterium]
MIFLLFISGQLDDKDSTFTILWKNKAKCRHYYFIEYVKTAVHSVQASKTTKQKKDIKDSI